MKLNVKVIGALFLCVLLFFIFFSKTLYSFNLPTVTAALPVNDKLYKSETVKGIVDWADVEEIYAETGGKLEEVLVSEGDKVTKGQPLFHFSFDGEDVERALRELANNRQKTALDIENINLKLDKLQRNIADLEAETYEKDTISDYELTQLESKISKLKEDYEKAKGLKAEEYEQSKILFDVGALTRQDLDALERDLERLDYDYAYNLQDLQAQHENLLKSLTDKEKEQDESVTDKEKAKQKTLLDYQHDIRMLQQDLKAKSLELSNMDIQEEKYRNTLADYDKSLVITAPSDATVITVPVKKGQLINANTKLISLGVGSEYIVNCNISLDNNFVAAGDVCDLSNSSHTLEGTVTKLTPVESGKQVTVTVTSEEVSAGETFDVYFEKESTDKYIMVPNGAVNRDSDGYFLYQVKRRDGILGKEYYVEKLRVYIGDSDNENTVVTKGVTFFEPVVHLSDKPFSENDTVLLGNEGDFFASE